MQIEQVEALMEQVGPVLDPLELTYFPNETVWGLRLDEDTSLLVDCDLAQHKLVLSCDLGAPPVGDRGRLYELMLSYNFQWHATGGGRLAIDGPEGNAGLIFDLTLSDLDVTKLAGTVRNFSQAASDWRQIVRQTVLQAADDPAPPADSTIIRI